MNTDRTIKVIKKADTLRTDRTSMRETDAFRMDLIQLKRGLSGVLATIDKLLDRPNDTAGLPRK